MGLLSPIILILLGTVDRLRDELTVSNTIASQFIGHDLPGFTAMTAQEPFEEAFCSSSVTPGLQKNINYFAILIHGSPQVMLLAVNFDEDFIDVEGIAIASVLPLQAAGINRSELDAEPAP